MSDVDVGPDVVTFLRGLPLRFFCSCGGGGWTSACTVIVLG